MLWKVFRPDGTRDDLRKSVKQWTTFIQPYDCGVYFICIKRFVSTIWKRVRSVVKCVSETGLWNFNSYRVVVGQNFSIIFVHRTDSYDFGLHIERTSLRKFDSRHLLDAHIVEHSNLTSLHWFIINLESNIRRRCISTWALIQHLSVITFVMCLYRYIERIPFIHKTDNTH